MRRHALQLLLLLAIGVALLAAAAPALAEVGGKALNNGQMVYAQANICAKGRPNPGGCCCAARRGPITKRITRFKTVRKTVRVKRTRTTTVTLTNSVALPNRRLAERAAEPALELERIAEQDERVDERSFDEPEVDSVVGSADEQTMVEQDGHQLSARNLCPVCPAGQPVLRAGALKTGVKPVYCCAARKTVTRIIRRTRTKAIRKTRTIVRTATFVPNNLTVIVFFDDANDGSFQPGDQLQPGIQVDLVYAPPLNRRGAALCIVLDTGTTNSAGAVNFGFGVVPPNTTLCISRHQSCAPCFVTLQAGADGRVPENTTLEVPIPPATTTVPAVTTSLTATNSATQSQTVITTSATASLTQPTTSSTPFVSPTAILYDTPGTHTFTAPPLVTEVHVACLGGGAGGGFAGFAISRRLGKREADPDRATGGGGGGLGWLNNIPVVQGTNYTVVVGSGGNKGTVDSYPANVAGTAGGHSYFESIAVVAGCGGSPGSGGGFAPAGSGGAGGGALTPPSPPSDPLRRLEARLPSSFPSSGGGGAGGYNGTGGTGGYAPDNNATAGSGGGGGGGFATGADASASWTSGSGGSTGLGGIGTDGFAGSTTYTGGGGGSGGCDGFSELFSASIRALTGAGGGANGDGGHGACRVVWGTGTSYPSNVPAVPGCDVA